MTETSSTTVTAEPYVQTRSWACGCPLLHPGALLRKLLCVNGHKLPAEK